MPRLKADDASEHMMMSRRDAVLALAATGAVTAALEGQRAKSHRPSPIAQDAENDPAHRTYRGADELGGKTSDPADSGIQLGKKERPENSCGGQAIECKVIIFERAAHSLLLFCVVDIPWPSCFKVTTAPWTAPPARHATPR